MAYATLQDLRESFPNDALVGGLADDDASAVRALAAAEAVIDGYVSAVHVLPLASVPAMLRDVACDLARYRLYDEVPGELILQRNQAAMGMLRDIVRGLVKLPLADGSQPEPTGQTVGFSGAGRVFTAVSLKGF